MKTASFDAPVIRVKISQEMIGADCLLITDENYHDMPYGELHNAEITIVLDEMKRSLTQLGLYWAACKLVADNISDPNWNTQSKVDEQAKIAAKHYEYYIYYQNKKTKEMTLHIKTRSIAFRNLAHLDACGYFTEAFQSMADKLKITPDELIEATKAKMKARYI